MSLASTSSQPNRLKDLISAITAGLSRVEEAGTIRTANATDVNDMLAGPARDGSDPLHSAVNNFVRSATPEQLKVLDQFIRQFASLTHSAKAERKAREALIHAVKTANLSVNDSDYFTSYRSPDSQKLNIHLEDHTNVNVYVEDSSGNPVNLYTVTQDDLAKDGLKFVVNERSSDRSKEIIINSTDPEIDQATRDHIKALVTSHLNNFILKRDAHIQSLERIMQCVIAGFTNENISEITARAAASSGWRNEGDAGEAFPASFTIRNHDHGFLRLTGNHFLGGAHKGFEEGKIAHLQIGQDEIYTQTTIMDYVNAELKAQFDTRISELLELPKERTTPKA